MPVTRSESQSLGLSVGCLYTPLHRDVEIINRPPVTCTKCRLILNPFVQHDAFWTCNCGARHQLPMGCETEMAQTTVEYVVGNVQCPPIYLLTIDMMISAEELQTLKETVVTGLSLLDPHALVGLVTYGSNAMLHEFGLPMKKQWVFKPVSDISSLSTTKLQQLLGLDPVLKPWNTSSTIQRFFQSPDAMIQSVESLTPTPQELVEMPAKRPEVCTGTALLLAASLMENACANGSGRMLCFLGGPCTMGIGKVVDVEKKFPMRSHSDREASSLWKPAEKVYEHLASKAISNKDRKPNAPTWSYNLFVGCYNQVGLYEMEMLCNKTGGGMVLADSFSTMIFKSSFASCMDSLQDGTLEVITSNGLKIDGAIGLMQRLGSPLRLYSDTPIGHGFTNKWKLNELTHRHSYAVMFSTDSVSKDTERMKMPNQVQIQFQTKYKKGLHEILRVTTVVLPTTNHPGAQLRTSFDQEAAIVLLTRQAVWKLLPPQSHTIDHTEVVRWLDKTLVTFCVGYGSYTKKVPESFQLESSFSLLPQFAYNLKRSPIMNIFNSSPDETSYYHHTLLRSDVTDSLVMIQPQIISFTPDSEDGIPVLLDSSSLRDDAVLLLDVYFYVVIRYGTLVAQWRDANLSRDEYEHIYGMWESAQKEAKEIISNRWPLPRYVTTDAGKSQDRFVISRLNPSNELHAIHTEDISLATFYQSLGKLVVDQASRM